MSKLREYLLNNGSIEELKDKYLIKTRRHCKYDNLVLFTYDIGCDFREEFQLECRGIILDQDNSWEVVSRPYDKFFNLGESRASEIEWETAVVTEKLDGSMIQAYMYNGHWNFGTTGTPDANVPVNDFNITFEQLFIQALQDHNQWPLPELPQFTLLFELCSEYNRVVVQHQGAKAYLIDCRDCISGIYLSNQIGKCENYFKPRKFNINNLEELLASIETFKGSEMEGFVICDAFDRRVKAKHPDYVQLHHALSGTNLKSLVSIALKGEVPETLSYFPYLTDTLNKIQEILENKTKEIDQYYLRGKDIPSRKEYAQFVKDTPYAWVLFKMKDTNLSSLEILREERIENVIYLLELK